MGPKSTQERQPSNTCRTPPNRPMNSQPATTGPTPDTEARRHSIRDHEVEEPVRKLLALCAVTGPGRLTWSTITRETRAGNLARLWAEHDGDNQHTAAARMRRHLAAATTAGAHILTILDPCYPARLAERDDAPPVLFLQGNPGALQRPAVAILGASTPTPAGTDRTVRLARELAAAGLGVAAALDTGIAAAALHATLEAGGHPIAVTDTGVAHPPATETRNLHDTLGRGGVLLSPFWPGQPPTPYTAVIRDRVLAGLASTVTVMEATAHSGVTSTARLAHEWGRDVWLPSRVVTRNRWAGHMVGRGEAAVLRYADEITGRYRERLTV